MLYFIFSLNLIPSGAVFKETLFCVLFSHFTFLFFFSFSLFSLSPRPWTQSSWHAVRRSYWRRMARAAAYCWWTTWSTISAACTDSLAASPMGSCRSPRSSRWAFLCLVWKIGGCVFFFACLSLASNIWFTEWQYFSRCFSVSYAKDIPPTYYHSLFSLDHSNFSLPSTIFNYTGAHHRPGWREDHPAPCPRGDRREGRRQRWREGEQWRSSVHQRPARRARQVSHHGTYFYIF